MKQHQSIFQPLSLISHAHTLSQFLHLFHSISLSFCHTDSFCLTLQLTFFPLSFMNTLTHRTQAHLKCSLFISHLSTHLISLSLTQTHTHALFLFIEVVRAKTSNPSFQRSQNPSFNIDQKQRSSRLKKMFFHFQFSFSASRVW